MGPEVLQTKPWEQYLRIAQAMEFYNSRGYKPLEAPWFVSRKAMEVTAPPGLRYCTSFLGDLVASGEQSFIQMWMDGKLKPGKWQCMTPCFRDEKVVDNLHLNCFIKVELIDVLPKNVEKSIEDIIKHATMFFDNTLCGYYIYQPVNTMETPIGKDIVSSSGIELGSYGYREYGDFKWVYGTGIAEPRLSHVINLR